MDGKEFRREERKVLQRTALPRTEEISAVKRSLEEVLLSETGTPGQVISILIYDRGRMSVNNYLTELDERTIFGRFNLSTQHKVKYPCRLPDEGTYRRGYFIPANLFRLRNGQSMPKDAYVALGRSFPVLFDSEQTVISYVMPRS